jgi:hypothetical protein
MTKQYVCIGSSRGPGVLRNVTKARPCSSEGLNPELTSRPIGDDMTCAERIDLAGRPIRAPGRAAKKGIEIP